MAGLDRPKTKLGGGNSNICYFHPGSLFQMGWFNHQLARFFGGAQFMAVYAKDENP